MTKQATSIRLSEYAQRNIDKILAEYGYLEGNRTSAIELALWYLADHQGEKMNAAAQAAHLALARPAARPARPKAAKKKEQER